MPLGEEDSAGRTLTLVSSIHHVIECAWVFDPEGTRLRNIELSKMLDLLSIGASRTRRSKDAIFLPDPWSSTNKPVLHFKGLHPARGLCIDFKL